ncbi:hypothetical protein ES708_11991 [subsurface metagenome]
MQAYCMKCLALSGHIPLRSQHRHELGGALAVKENQRLVDGLYHLSTCGIVAIGRVQGDTDPVGSIDKGIGVLDLWLFLFFLFLLSYYLYLIARGQY